MTQVRYSDRFKPGPNRSSILRNYEASGNATRNVQINLHVGVTSDYEANMLEVSGRKLKVQNSTVQFDLHSFEIKTIKLILAPSKPTR